MKLILAAIVALATIVGGCHAMTGSTEVAQQVETHTAQRDAALNDLNDITRRALGVANKE